MSVKKKAVINTAIFGILQLAKVGGGFGYHGGHRQVVHTKVDKPIQYALTFYIVMSVCSLSYPACNAYAPYCTVTSGLSGTTIFYQIISHRERFSEVGGGELRIIKSVLIFSTNLLTETFLILRRIHRCLHVKYSFFYRSSRKVLVFLSAFT